MIYEINIKNFYLNYSKYQIIYYYQKLDNKIWFLNHINDEISSSISDLFLILINFLIFISKI